MHMSTASTLSAVARVPSTGARRRRRGCAHANQGPRPKYRTWSSDAIRLEPANRVNFNPSLKGFSANAHFNVTCIQAHHVAQDDHRGLGGFFPVASIVEPLEVVL